MRRFNGKYDEIDDPLEEWNQESDNYQFMRDNDSRYAKGAFWIVLAGCTLAAVAVWLFSGCSLLTVAPKPVQAKEIAFDANKQNAGIIDCDKTGCLVTPGWIGRYRLMEKEFNTSLPDDILIKAEGANYRVPFDVSNKYAEMRQAERGP